MEALRKYDDTSNVASDKTLVSAWDAFQQDVSHFKIIFKCSADILFLKKFRCCGVDDFADWSEENELFGGTPKSWVTTSRPDYNPRPERRVPESCCDSSSNQVKIKQTFVLQSGQAMNVCFMLFTQFVLTTFVRVVFSRKFANANFKLIRGID